MITGPFYKTSERRAGVNNNVVEYRYQRWYRQQPRTSAPLAYFTEYNWGSMSAGQDVNSWSIDRLSFTPSWIEQVKKKAYDRFKDAIAEPASLAVSIAERKQSMKMLGDRLTQLWKFTRAIRRGNLTEAAHHVGLAEPPHRVKFNPRRSARNVGGTWLEYHLGWKPLIGDIYNCVDVLQRGLPPFRVRGRARDIYESTYVNDASTTRWVRQQIHVQYQAMVTVSDPNLWQANQLGLINPAVVAWELVPFSFVLDWFLPIGDFLSQYTDFVGLTLSQSATTYYVITERKTTWKPWWYYGAVDRQNAFVVERSLGISQPALVFNRVTGLSPTRAATAISLLLQSLRG